MNRSLVALAGSSSRTVTVVAILPAILALTAGREVHGQGTGDDAAVAKAHYATGVRHFDLSEFEQALVEFKEAYRAKPDPVFLYNIGQCHRRLGHTDDAITFYQTYLRRAPDAKNREEVERRIAELESLREAENASITSSAVAKPRPSPASQAAQERAVAEASVPAPALAVGLDARTEAPASSPRPIYKRWWFWAATGAAAAGAATLGIVMVRRDPTSVPGSTLGAQRAMP